MKYINEIQAAAERDPSAEVKREYLLSLRNLGRGDQFAILPEITRIAYAYNGSDRYMLETINIAAGPFKQEIYRRLAKGDLFSPGRFQLLKLLDPDAAAETLKEQLAQAAQTMLFKRRCWPRPTRSPRPKQASRLSRS